MSASTPLREGRSEIDDACSAVADAFMIGRRVTVEAFED